MVLILKVMAVRDQQTAMTLHWQTIGDGTGNVVGVDHLVTRIESVTPGGDGTKSTVALGFWVEKSGALGHTTLFTG